MQISFESPDQPDIIALIADLDAYQLTLYPPECVYSLDLVSLMQPNVRFAVARDASHAVVGCCAIVLGAEYGEIKRMYVQPSCRGQGTARRMLDLLEQAAQAAGCTAMMLETGPAQPEALAVYRRHGFEQRGPYGAYRDDPLSIFMQKTLATD